MCCLRRAGIATRAPSCRRTCAGRTDVRLDKPADLSAPGRISPLPMAESNCKLGPNGTLRRRGAVRRHTFKVESGVAAV